MEKIPQPAQKKTREILAQTKKKLLKDKNRVKQISSLKKGNELPVMSTIDKTEQNTRKELSEDLGWSSGKVAEADVVWKGKQLHNVTSKSVNLPENSTKLL